MNPLSGEEQAEMIALCRYLRDHYTTNFWMGDMIETYPMDYSVEDDGSTWRERFDELMNKVAPRALTRAEKGEGGE